MICFKGLVKIYMNKEKWTKERIKQEAKEQRWNALRHNEGDIPKIPGVDVRWKEEGFPN